MKFDVLFEGWSWKPIHRCPGRFILSADQFSGPPRELVGAQGNVRFHEFQVETTRDPVVVARLQGDGGLISYKQRDGTYIHTLNTPEGFERKLSQLRIELDSP